MSTADKIKRMIVEEMYLEGVTFDSIDDAAPLFQEGLGLDSLDAIELVLLVKTHFGVAIMDIEEGRKAFRSVNALAEYVDRAKESF